MTIGQKETKLLKIRKFQKNAQKAQNFKFKKHKGAGRKNPKTFVNKGTKH